MSDMCADAAFLNMVHLYKKVLGANGFPHGVFAWPPFAWVRAYHDSKRKKEVEAKTTGQEGGASSSTGSSAPTTASARPTFPDAVPIRVARNLRRRL